MQSLPGGKSLVGGATLLALPPTIISLANDYLQTTGASVDLREDVPVQVFYRVEIDGEMYIILLKEIWACT